MLLAYIIILFILSFGALVSFGFFLREWIRDQRTV